MLGLLLNWRAVLAMLVLGVVITAWARFQFLQHQHQADAAALAHARQMLAAATASASIRQTAINASEATHAAEQRTHVIVAQAQGEIAHAADFSALYAAWSAGIDRVRHDATVADPA